ncbi:MAG: 50S ribosomal protein L25 [Planctomycetota bacterium]
MAHIEPFAVQERPETGTTAVRRLRRASLIPGNVYGHEQDPRPVKAAEEAVRALAYSGHHVVEIDAMGGGKQQAVLKDVQWDALGRDILHFDLQRVDAEEVIQVDVPVHTKGDAPGVIAGGILDFTHHAVPVECPAASVPDEIKINIGAMKFGDAFRVSDLEMPEGVKVLLDDGEPLIQIIAPKGGMDAGDDEGDTASETEEAAE